jgi:hypothetical protein
MPATAAIDNETLDHLLSVVDDSGNLRGFRQLSKPGHGRGAAGGAFATLDKFLVVEACWC